MTELLNLIVPGALILTVGIGAARLVRRGAQGRAAARAGYFDAVRPLFKGGVKTISPHGFARLSARYRGQPFDLQALPDTLTFRKLPALWLMVTLPAPMPVLATFDLMMRPGGGETFSHFARLPLKVAPPAFCPPEAQIRADDATGLPPEAVLRRHLVLFGQDRAKELVISPRGLRIVWLAEEADRTRYLMFRDAEMGTVPLAPELLQPLLDRLIALQADLVAQAEGPVAAEQVA
jgi:hypothetical protein